MNFRSDSPFKAGNIKRPGLIALLLSMVTFQLNAQTAEQDEKLFHQLKIRERSIYSAAVKWPQQLKESKNYRVSERYPDGTPMLIRFEIVQGFTGLKKDDWRKLSEVTIKVYCKNNLPFAVAPEIDVVKKPFPTVYYTSGDEINKLPESEDFTSTQRKLIDQYFTGDSKAIADNSPSYAAVVKKLAGYPKEWDMKNCIGIVYNLRDHYALTSKPITAVDPSSGDPVVLNTMLDYVYDGQVNEKQYRNISNHPIIIKGIMKKRVRDGYIYSDESLKVEPGAVFPYFTIFKEYDPLKETDYNIVDYFGDAGTISSAMVAKAIRPGVLEVDSYTNITTIQLNKGDKITLTATGKITVGILAGETGPEGISGFEKYSREPDLAHGQLIGRIGNSGWFKVGKSAAIVAPNKGYLELALNDGDPQNNVGSFTVQYSIVRAKP